MAGSTAKKLGKEEGTTMAAPVGEFYYKDDALADRLSAMIRLLYMAAVLEQGRAR